MSLLCACVVVLVFCLVTRNFLIVAGVYKPIPEAQRIGEITLKIFGWGVEKEVEYWLATNIWKKDFGDGGIIKIEAFNPKLKLESGIIGGRFEGVPATGSKDDQGARSVNPSSGNKDCC